jgi:DNA-directed RNA polymerase specialized sigma subunit
LTGGGIRGGTYETHPTYEGMCFSANQFDANALFDFLTSLPERQKLACSLYLVGDRAGPLTESEVAEKLCVAQPTARELIQKGLARLAAAGIRPKRDTGTRAA